MHPQISQVAGKRAALLATFGSMTASSESCSHQFSSMSSIGRVPPDSSGDACLGMFIVRAGLGTSTGWEPMSAEKARPVYNKYQAESRSFQGVYADGTSW